MGKKSTIKEIGDFAKHLYGMGNKCLDMYYAKKPYDETDYNIKISCYGKTIEIDLNADFVEALDGILQNEIAYMKKHEPKN